MLPLLGIVLSQCESGRLTETVPIPRYAPSCCEEYSSYLWSADVDQALRARLNGAYVTVAPGSQPGLELPTSEYLISNGMTLNLQEYYLDADHAALNLSATATAIGTVEWCEAQAHALNLTFAVQVHSNGAPAGCAQYATKVVFVETCTAHANCDTTTCNGCTLLAVSAAMYAYVHLSYAAYPAGYPANEPHAGAVNYSIGANRNGDVYGQYAHGNGAAVFRIYVDECPFPPSAPPPPPVTAMCNRGYWPLYPTEAEARAVSPANATHTHEFYGVTYYMPDAFDGAMHAEVDASCPHHATALPPTSPPLPPSVPPPGDPPSPPSPPAPPPPYQMPVELQVLLITVIPAALLVLLVVAWLAWCMYYGSPRGQQQNAREGAMEKRRFFKLDVAK